MPFHTTWPMVGTVKRQEHNTSTGTKKEVYDVYVVFEKCCLLHQNTRTEYVHVGHTFQITKPSEPGNLTTIKETPL